MLTLGSVHAVASEAVVTPVDLNEVLVTWDGGQITRGDYEGDIQRIPEKMRYEFNLDMSRVTKSIDSLLVNRVLSQEAVEKGLEQNPIVQAELKVARERVLSAARLEQLKDEVALPDFERLAREQYTLNEKSYVVPDTVSASHILVASKGRTDDEARALAESIRQKLLAGEDFEKLAREFSDDPGSKKRGGSLGDFSKGRMVKPFEDAVFALEKPGEISGIVKTGFGYHLIRLDGRKPGRVRSFDEVRDELIFKAREKFVSSVVADKISAIRNAPSIKINTENVDKIKTLPRTRPQTDDAQKDPTKRERRAN